MIRILADDAAQAVTVQEILGLFAQVQDHLGAALGAVHGLHGIFALAVGNPVYAFLPRQAGAAGIDLHLFGYDEGGIKPHAELAYQLRVPGLVACQRFKKLFGTGLGDGAQVIDHLLPGHADAVVQHGDGFLRLVVFHPDIQLRVVLEQAVVLQALEAQPVGGVRRIRDEFAQEYLLVAV